MLAAVVQCPRRCATVTAVPLVITVEGERRLASTHDESVQALSVPEQLLTRTASPNSPSSSCRDVVQPCEGCVVLW